MALLPPFDQWSRFGSEPHFLFQHSFNIGNPLIGKQTSQCGILPHDMDAVFKNLNVTVFLETLNCSLECPWTLLNESPWKFRGWERDDSDPLRRIPDFHLICHGGGSECLVNSVVS